MLRANPNEARMKTNPTRPILFCLLLLLSPTHPAPLRAADHLDLIIPSFRVENATIDQALIQLDAYGLVFSLEWPSDAPNRLVSVDLQGKSIREILDALMPHDSGLSWTAYRAQARGGRGAPIINVFPTSRKHDRGYIMNTVIEQFELNEQQNFRFFSHLHEIVSELTALRRVLIHQTGEVGSGVVRVGIAGEDRRNEFWHRAALYRMPLRAILNEVALVFGSSWTYKETTDAWPHRWLNYLTSPDGPRTAPLPARPASP